MDSPDLHQPHFTRQQLLACVPGLSEEVFKQWVIRGVVSLHDKGRVGKGRRRLYTPDDVFQVATFHEMARQGLLVSKVAFVWMTVRGRLIALDTAYPGMPMGYTALFTVHPTSGELVAATFCEDAPESAAALLESDDAPDVQVMFRVDRFVARIAARMQAIIEGNAPPPPPDPTRNEDPDFFRRWTTDAAGQRVLVGLSAKETAELERLQGQQMGGGFMGDHDLSARYLALSDRHESARQQRLGEEIAARMAAQNTGEAE